MRGEELPLVGVRKEPVIDEDGITRLPRAVLQRERDEVAESAARERVLVGEESVYDSMLNWWRRAIVSVMR